MGVGYEDINWYKAPNKLWADLREGKITRDERMVVDFMIYHINNKPQNQQPFSASYVADGTTFSKRYVVTLLHNLCAKGYIKQVGKRKSDGSFIYEVIYDVLETSQEATPSEDKATRPQYRPKQKGSSNTIPNVPTQPYQRQERVYQEWVAMPNLTVAQLEGESLLARQFFTFPFAVPPRAQSGGSLASRC